MRFAKVTIVLSVFCIVLPHNCLAKLTPPPGINFTCDNLHETLLYVPSDSIKSIKLWTEADFYAIADFAQKCIDEGVGETSKSFSREEELKNYVAMIPYLNSELKKEQAKIRESGDNDIKVTDSLNNFRKEISSLSIGWLHDKNDNDLMMAVYDKRMELMRKASQIISKYSGYFNGNKAELETDINELIRIKTEEIGTLALSTKKQAFTNRLKATKAYQTMLRKHPKDIDKQMIARYGIDDLDVSVGRFMACSEILQPNIEAIYNKRNIKLKNAVLDGQTMNVEFFLEDKDKYFYIRKIVLAKNNINDLGSKIGIVENFMKACKQQ